MQMQLIGQLIDGGRYRIERVLTPGSFGDVYVVRDLHEGDEAVLKLLNVNLLQGNVWQEAQILRHLADDHILPIRNAAIALGRPYIVTAYARHGTLEGALNATGGTGLPVDDAVTWIRQACMGVARAHDAGLVHNDLKPGNLFLTANRECQVGDFGAASVIAPGQRNAVPQGATPETVAPEVAATWGSGAATASVASDVYSLGATLYWLLAGKPPVDLAGAVDVVAQMTVAATQQRPRLRDVAPHVPQSVATVVEKAIVPNPGARYRSIGEFAAALGNRSVPARKWIRTNEHAGHIGCWRGERVGASTYVLCLDQGSRATSCTITTRHLGSGSRVPNGSRKCTARKWAQAVRAVMARVS
jgi:serine/threonine protein kinase